MYHAGQYHGPCWSVSCSMLVSIMYHAGQYVSWTLLVSIMDDAGQCHVPCGSVTCTVLVGIMACAGRHRVPHWLLLCTALVSIMYHAGQYSCGVLGGIMYCAGVMYSAGQCHGPCWFYVLCWLFPDSTQICSVPGGLTSTKYISQAPLPSGFQLGFNPTLDTIQQWFP